MDKLKNQLSCLSHDELNEIKQYIDSSGVMSTQSANKNPVLNAMLQKFYLNDEDDLEMLNLSILKLEQLGIKDDNGKTLMEYILFSDDIYDIFEDQLNEMNFEGYEWLFYDESRGINTLMDTHIQKYEIMKKYFRMYPVDIMVNYLIKSFGKITYEYDYSNHDCWSFISDEILSNYKKDDVEFVKQFFTEEMIEFIVIKLNVYPGKLVTDNDDYDIPFWKRVYNDTYKMVCEDGSDFNYVLEVGKLNLNLEDFDDVPKLTDDIKVMFEKYFWIYWKKLFKVFYKKLFKLIGMFEKSFQDDEHYLFIQKHKILKNNMEYCFKNKFGEDITVEIDDDDSDDNSDNDDDSDDDS